MGMMKERFSKEVEEAMATVSDYMDGDYEVFIASEIGKVFVTISKSLERFAVLKAVIKEAEDVYEGGNLWEDCCEYDEEFEELYEILKKVEEIFD